MSSNVWELSQTWEIRIIIYKGSSIRLSELKSCTCFHLEAALDNCLKKLCQIINYYSYDVSLKFQFIQKPNYWSVFSMKTYNIFKLIIQNGLIRLYQYIIFSEKRLRIYQILPFFIFFQMIEKNPSTLIEYSIKDEGRGTIQLEIYLYKSNLTILFLFH